MAAGLGFKTFATGDILTAADANGYLMSQTVMVFADATARSSAITSPQEGMITYLKDTNSTEYYSGSAWVALGGTSSATYVGAQVTNTSAQSISNGAYTAINFQSEIFDTDGFHDNATNNTRLTIPSGKAGKYLITAQANFASNSSGFRAIAIMKNGSASQIAYANSAPISGSSFTFAFSCVVSAAVADYYEMNVYQSSGGSLNVNSGSDSTRFDISYLGA